MGRSGVSWRSTPSEPPLRAPCVAPRQVQSPETGTARPFVVLDELNKYAPREGRGPIKEVLLDIAERGRSLGVVLIGAQLGVTV